MQDADTVATQPTWLTVNQLVEKHGIAPNTVKWWMFRRQSNGFASCVAKVGAHVFIREDLFFAWLDSQIEG